MNLKQWRERSKLTQAALAQELGLSQSQVSRYEENPDQIPYGLLKKWLARLGVDPGREPILTEHPSAPIDVGDPWAPLRVGLDRVVEACVQAKTEFADDWVEGVPTPEAIIETAKRLRHKPNLVFAGRSDSGKSRLANSFLGRHLLPTRYGPMTRLVTHVRHLDDRPEWLGDDTVAVIGGARTIESLPADEADAAVKRRGGRELLLTEATYEVGASADEEDSLTVYVYDDAPVLRAANLIDLPGSRGQPGHADADARRAHEASSAADVLVYTSTAGGFLDGTDLEFLSHWIRALPLTERDDPRFPVLGHLFVVATHAAHHISAQQLEHEILAGGRERLWQHVGHTAVAERAQLIDRKIERAELDGRFFAFWAERDELRTELHDEVAKCLGTWFPGARQRLASASFKALRDHAVRRLTGERRCLDAMLQDLVEAREAHERILTAEKVAAAMRRRRQRLLEESFDRTSAELRRTLEKTWASRTSVAAIEALIEERFTGPGAKERARQEAGSAVLELVRNDMFERSLELTASFPEKLKGFLQEYEETSDGVGSMMNHSSAELPTDGAGIFAGLIGGGIAAAIGLSGGLVLTVAGLFWAIFGSSWQSRLAKKVAEQLAESRIKDLFDSEIEAQWRTRRERFTTEAERLERDHQRHLEKHSALLDSARKNKRVVEEKREAIEDQLGFFRSLPWAS